MTGARCPQCGADSRVAFRTPDLNRRIGTTSFRYRHCSACGVFYVDNVPADLHRYYTSEYYVLPRSLEELAAWGEAERYKLDIVKRFNSGGRLIEIGPASGAFAYLAKR